MNKCQVVPAEGDKKVFKLLIERSEENKDEKVERFYTANVCSRACWIKKLLIAKNGCFDVDDCKGVPVDEMLAF